MKRIAIIGSRGFNNYETLKEHLESFKDVLEVISGGAKSADSLGERWAKDNCIPVKIFYPDWDKHGKAAGFIRNKDIVENSDTVIAFWDVTSKGTLHSINLAKTLGKEILIIKYG